MLREWYLHPNGQMPAYEGSFSDVNPPVHAFAVFQIYAIAAQDTGLEGYRLPGARLPEAAC